MSFDLKNYAAGAYTLRVINEKRGFYLPPILGKNPTGVKKNHLFGGGIFPPLQEIIFNF